MLAEASATWEPRHEESEDVLRNGAQMAPPTSMPIPVPPTAPSPPPLDWTARDFDAGRRPDVFHMDIVDTLVERLKGATKCLMEETLAKHHEDMVVKMRALLGHTFVHGPPKPQASLFPSCPAPGKQEKAEFQIDQKDHNGNISKMGESMQLQEASSGLPRNSAGSTLPLTSAPVPPEKRTSNKAKGIRPQKTMDMIRKAVTHSQMTKEDKILEYALKGRDGCTDSSLIGRQCSEKSTETVKRFGRRFSKLLQGILQDPLFEFGMGMAVCTNAIFIGWEIDHMTSNPSLAPPIHVICIAYFYTILFILELFFRLLADCRGFLCASAPKELMWNYLDVLIVFASLVEVALDIATRAGGAVGGDMDLSNLRVLRLVRVFRLIRLLRVARLVRFVRALRMLVFSIACVLKTVFWAMVLMLTIIYVFAILFTQVSVSYKTNQSLKGDVPMLDYYWGTVSRSMLSLFMSISGGISWIEVVKPLISISEVWRVLYLIYIFSVYFAILNVITGIFCQSALESCSEDQDSMLHTVMRHKELYTERFMELFEQIDHDNSGRIERHEFVARMEDEDVRDYFASLELQASDALVLFDVFNDVGMKGIEVDEFVLGCIRLKGTARSSDMVRLLHETKLLLVHVKNLVQHFQLEDKAQTEAAHFAFEIFQGDGNAVTHQKTAKGRAT